MEEFTINKAHNMQLENISSIGPTLPQRQLFHVGGDTTLVKSDYGQLLFQRFPVSIADIWLGHYRIKESAGFYAASKEPALEMQFMFNADAEYDLAGHGRVRQRQGYFNLSYVPYIENSFYLEKGTHIFTFDVHYTLDHLESMLPYFSGLSKFIEKVYRKEPVQLAKGGVRTNAGIISKIFSILGPTVYNLKGLSYLVERELEILLFQSLSNAFGNSRFKIKGPSSSEVESLEAVRNYLIENLDQVHSLKEIARQFFINEFKLKSLFKQRFGMPVIAFQRQEQMNRAALLLQTTEMSIQEIAHSVGYSNHRAFLDAFKSKKGITPGRFRKQF